MQSVRERHATPQPAHPPDMPAPSTDRRREESSSATQAVSTGQADALSTGRDPYAVLLTLTAGDADRAEELVDAERGKNPLGDREAWVRAAVTAWLTHNA